MPDVNYPVPALATRFERHTQSCQACLGAYNQLVTIRQASWVGAVTSIALSLLTVGLPHQVFVVSFVLAMAAIAATKSLETRFL